MAKRKKKAETTTESGNAAKPVLYAVLRLNEAVEVQNYLGEACLVNVAFGDTAGYLPVYKTVEAAQKHSQDGKYSIVAIAHSV